MNISKSMLNMSCTVLEVVGMDSDRNPIYSEPQTLNNIWITFETGTVNGPYGHEAADTMTLLYDCENSLPRNFTFNQGMKIVYNNSEFTVQKVKPGIGLSGLEHYEVTLK